MVQITEKDWSEIKQFKDPVYGYIPVCRAYVKSLIDTQLMQRIKGVAQTGLRPVFSSATHDRFSHSLGVYHFGTAMYRSLASKLQLYMRDTCCPQWALDEEKTGEFLLELGYRLRHWNTLLAIGCLLHDIGHPVQSHGFEFLYDDPYLDMKYGEPGAISLGEGMDTAEWERVYDIFVKQPYCMEKAPEGNLSSALLASFRARKDRQSQNFPGSLPGKPHERMSAYYIFEDASLRESAEALIKASRKMAAEESGRAPEPCGEQELSDDLCFIARMIIGWEYPVKEQLKFDERAFFDSLQNCVIHILNGIIDADGIDYLMRNSYAAGYDTSRIDSVRLCNAYTAYAKNYVLFPAFSKSALSVLEGFMSARDFEPKWLYSHHKVVYADLLTKQLYKYFTRYWTDRTMLLPSVKRILAHAKDSAIVCSGNQNLGKDLLLLASNSQGPQPLGLKALQSHMQQWSYPFYTYLLAPCRTYSLQSHKLHQTADADMESMYHWIACELKQYTDPTGGGETEGYPCYCQSLKQQTLSGLSDSALAEIPLRDLRILLAENCLETAKTVNEDVRQLLRRWIESGDHAAAVREAEGLGLDTQAFQVADEAGEDRRKLLEYWLERYQPLLAEGDFEHLNELLEEYQTRRYRSSLWKSQAEYQLFLADCAADLGITSNDVRRYMEALIDGGMDECGFSIFDGKVVKNTPALYQEQFYYLPHMSEDRRKQAANLVAKRENLSGTVTLRATGKEIAQKWAKFIFAKNQEYDFSRNRLVAKFYTVKSKRFDKIDLVFGNRVVPLENIFPYHKTGGRFPYFYYSAQAGVGPEKILRPFRDSFIKFCREYRESEARSEIVRAGMSHMFRDAVYGDIKMTDDFYDVVCTKEFQRLGRIRQLATADRSFPNATHTRLAHSLGTWHVMGMILDHFEGLYRTSRRLAFTEKDRSCALLAALLHDLGHGPYSHMIETAFRLNHEKMSCKILMDPDTEIHQKIKERFGAEMPNRVCRLLDSGIALEAADRIGLIYRNLISGQLDADRIDYLLRDNVVCGMAFGHIDIQQLIASMRLMPEYSGEDHIEWYQLCFNDRYLPAIEQFIYARFQMYRNVYHDPVKQLFEEIYKLLFRQVFKLQDAVRPDPTLDLLRRISGGADPTAQEYLRLDDEAVNALIKKWADGEILAAGMSDPALECQARMIQKLARAFLYQDELFQRIDLGGRPQQYDLLAQRVGKQMGQDCSTFNNLDSCAFIYIQGSDCAYQSPGNAADGRKSIILRSMDDGTTSDYAQRSMFRAAEGAIGDSILKMDYCYLFFSEDLLKEECGMQPKMAEVVKQTVESAKPRKHIEIENKFYCTQEQLEQAKSYLDKTYKEIKSVKKAQTDTYYDCPLNERRWVLFEKRFSFRRREKDNRYIFTVKIPTDSPNYHSSSQFARHEHEFVSAEPGITDEVWQFLLDTLDICGESELRGDLDRNRLGVLLVVHNQRITYRLEGRCEICLDTVNYTTRDQKPIGDRNYQIEIELLGEPESWPELAETVIEPLTRELGTIRDTSRSKLETGMDLLQAEGPMSD